VEVQVRLKADPLPRLAERTVTNDCINVIIRARPAATTAWRDRAAIVAPRATGG